MPTASIGGLASGLDTAAIVSQLMQLEAIPQAQLKSRVTDEQARVSALQSLNTRLAALATAAKDMVSPAAGTTSVWQALQASSSNSAVTVTASSEAAPAAYSVDVVATARAHRIAFTDAHAPGAVVTGGTIELDRLDGAGPVSLNVGGGTLQEVADAINDPANATGLQATLVQVSPGSFRLLVESTATGAEENFALTAGGGPLLGGPASEQTARDAEISLGGITVTSPTNTIADVIPGVTITLGAAATGTADITVTRDATARSAAVKKLVEDLNGVISTIATQTAYSPAGGTAGVLNGNATVRGVASELADTIYPGDGTTLAPYGIQLDRYGKLVFDEKAFAEAYAADPDAVTAAIVGPDGFATRVQEATEKASDKHSGTITTLVTSGNDGIKRLNDRIEDWDGRLELRQRTLERQYTALEVALSKLNSQSEWLTGQLAALTNNNSD